MPYIRVQTNAELDNEAAAALASKVSTLASLLTGKPERWVMASVEPGAALVYGGLFEAAAFVEFKSIGLDAAMFPELSAALCGLLEAEAKIPADRVYIEFTDLPRAMFGWNSTTF